VCFIVRDHNGQALAYVHFEEESVECIMCSRFHFVNPATGAVLGLESRKERPNRGNMKARYVNATRAMSDWSDETTDNPLYADDRNLYKVELWTKDNQRVLRMIYAGNNLDRARTIFANYIRLRPRASITIRQRTRVLDQWPRQDG
jgi:hypothetical protein